MKFLSIAFLLPLIASCGMSGLGKPVASVEKNIWATVNGEEISQEEVSQKIQSHLNKLKLEEYKVKTSGINQLIEEMLLEQAAVKEGKKRQVFVDDFLAAYVKEPTEDEVRKYYEQNKNQFEGKTFDEAKQSLTNILKTKEQTATLHRLIDNLRSKANISIKLEPPRIEIPIAESLTIGPENAPVTVIEFCDYQCPFCNRARSIVEKIIETWPKQVRYVFKDFPSSFHKNALKAHEASYCAGEQGKYWEMHEALFENQQNLEVANIKQYAQKIGLNDIKFNECLDKGAYQDRVARGIQIARNSGAIGSPVFYINGIMVSGPRPFEYFKEIIEDELAGKK